NAGPQRNVGQGDRFVQVDGPLQLLGVQQLVRIGQIGADHRGVVVGQQRSTVGEDHRVVVDVDDLGIRLVALCDLVDVVLGGQPTAVVDELPNAALLGQEPHGALQERAILPGEQQRFRRYLQQF